jgi:hypothetical protein
VVGEIDDLVLRSCLLDDPVGHGSALTALLDAVRTVARDPHAAAAVSGPCRCDNRTPVPYDGGMAEVSAQASQPEGLDRETLIVAGVVLLGAIMSILDTTVVNVAIDHLAVAFHSSLTTIQWVITGYTLALAAVIPVTGWAADRFGTKRIYLWSLVLFTLGSVLSGLAWSAGSLIFFRVLQASAAA